MTMIITEARYIKPEETHVELNSSTDSYSLSVEWGDSAVLADLDAYVNGLPQSGWYTQKALYDQYLLDVAQWEVAHQEWVDAGSDPETEPLPPEVVDEQSPVDPADIVPGVIDPYDKYFGWDVPQAQQVKYGEGNSYADELIDEANANPYVGYTTEPKKNKQRVAQRTKHNTNGKPPSDTDKDRDDELADREDEILDANDSVFDIIEDGQSVEEIMAIDIATAVDWGVWNPPT